MISVPYLTYLTTLVVTPLQPPSVLCSSCPPLLATCTCYVPSPTTSATGTKSGCPLTLGFVACSRFSWILYMFTYGKRVLWWYDAMFLFLSVYCSPPLFRYTISLSHSFRPSCKVLLPIPSLSHSTDKSTDILSYPFSKGSQCQHCRAISLAKKLLFSIHENDEIFL